MTFYMSSPIPEGTKLPGGLEAWSTTLHPRQFAFSCFQFDILPPADCEHVVVGAWNSDLRRYAASSRVIAIKLNASFRIQRRSYRKVDLKLIGELDCTSIDTEIAGGAVEA